MNLESGSSISPPPLPPPPPPPPLSLPSSQSRAKLDTSNVRHQEAGKATDRYMRETSHAGLSPAVVEIIAGLSAGTVATLVVHPLDIVKTRMQISQSCASAAAHNKSTVAILRSLANNPHPIASLYRGLTPNLTGNALSWASFFFFKARFEKLLASRRGPGALPTPSDYFVSSALGGAVTTALSNPIWVIKTRMLSSDRGSHGAYPSMLSGARSILRTEGPRGFYRGLGVSLIGVSHGAVQFAHLTTEATVVISSCAKLVAGAVTYPYQVLRSRLQNYQADDRFGKGLKGVVKRTWGEEGIRGFYRGLVPGVVRVMPATWVTFLVYENVRYYLPRWTSS
ncbi:Mitochondrial FAD carrier protein FLX1 [Escovopsis weberi]|uniref:Mitochondrial FAD carrier protein FLX1 n=1 Tax=Escovopsis weberi TaxID=150374 RepID=A0A0M8N2J3_ESCWE|nr:Mitochondrial FAD carrier protein FLX1 [Escovopsis weberi]